MLRDAGFLALHELKLAFRSKETLIWAFVMPVVFFYFIGTITSGFGGGSSGKKDVLAIQVPAEAGFLFDRLQHQLEARDFELVRPETEEEFQRYARRLRVPEGFTTSVLNGEAVKLSFDREGAGLGTDFDEVRLQRAVYSVLADIIATAEDGVELDPQAFERLDAEPRALTLTVNSAGKRKEPPTGFDQSVPGTMVMFVLLVLLTSGIQIVIERREGVLRRLASAPISRGAIVLGKWGGRMGLAVVQIAYALMLGTVLFGVDWGPNLPVIFLMLVAYAALGAMLGLWLGNLARTEGQATALGVVASNVLAPLGGCWWPIEITPDWAQTIALFVPTGWAMDGMHKLVSFGYGAEAVWPHVLGMLVAAMLLGALIARRFRFQ